jgi:hypothetical protein
MVKIYHLYSITTKDNVDTQDIDELQATFEQVGKDLIEKWTAIVEAITPAILASARIMRLFYLRQRYYGFFEKVGEKDE